MAIVDLGIEGLSEYRQIGSGGFAVVYSANEEGAGRLVAVKVLHSVNEAGRRRFERERRTMGRTTGHANIVTMFRSGFTEADNRPYLVMEYLDGGSLRDRLDRTGPLPLTEAIAVTADIADALRFSHGAGILHKDIKPANVLLSSSGAAKLTDFGIAAIQEATDASQIAYSMTYTAPESFAATHDPVDGSVVDPRDERSDLYSLGATFYALVTGRPPFEGPNQVALMRQIVESGTPPTGHPGVDRFMATALAKDPSDRFPDAETFGQALGHIESITDAPTAIQPPIVAATSAPSHLAAGPEAPVGPEAAAPGPGTPTLPVPGPTQPTTAATPDRVERRAGRGPVLAVGALIVAAIAGAGWFLLSDDGDGGDAGPITSITGQTVTSVADEPPSEPEDEIPADSVFAGHRDRAGDPSEDGVVALIQLADGRLASAGADGSAQVWDPNSLDQPAAVYTGHDEGVQALAELDGGRVASASADGTVKIWRPEDPSVTLATYDQHRTEADDPGEDGIASVIQLSDGRVASASGFGTVHVWDPDRVDDPPVVFSGHRDRAANEDIDGVVQVIELTDGRLASAGNDGSVQVWDLDDPAGTATIYEGHTDRVLTVAQLAGGRLASAGADTTVQVWDLDDPTTALATYLGHDERVLAIVQLADGRVATGGSDGTVQIWDPDEPGTPILASYARHRDEATDPDEDAVTALAVLADGRVASASADGTVRLWIP